MTILRWLLGIIVLNGIYMEIIIQAGGKGTRLEGLTRNKPKCLVPINNLPIIEYTFRKFPRAQFLVIADYRMDTLKKYLTTFESQYDCEIIKAQKQGTVSGIREALTRFSDHEPVVIMWSV